jgi:hypothetical protein
MWNKRDRIRGPVWILVTAAWVIGALAMVSQCALP